MKIVVASKNPVKIEAVISGFQQMLPDKNYIFEGISAESGVPDQPIGSEQTYLGALNRVDNASKLATDADYWVGLEGGIADTELGMQAFAWIIIKSKSGKYGKGQTSAFVLPEKIAVLVRGGMELGDADDHVFKQTNSKQAQGTVGNLTAGIITRAKYYSEAVIMALIPFKNPELY